MIKFDSIVLQTHEKFEDALDKILKAHEDNDEEDDDEDMDSGYDEDENKEKEWNKLFSKSFCSNKKYKWRYYRYLIRIIFYWIKSNLPS